MLGLRGHIFNSSLISERPIKSDSLQPIYCALQGVALAKSIYKQRDTYFRVIW